MSHIIDFALFYFYYRNQMCVEIVTRGLPYHAVKEDEMVQQIQICSVIIWTKLICLFSNKGG